MLHTMWHQCHCDLYRFMLPGIRESLPDEALNTTLPEYTLYCQTRAVKHAKALVDIFRMVQKVGDQTPQDPGISICVFQCTRILIRAFDIGLLGSQSTAIELLYQLKSVTKILLPITAVNQFAAQLVSYTLHVLAGTACQHLCILKHNAHYGSLFSTKRPKSS